MSPFRIKLVEFEVAEERQRILKNLILQFSLTTVSTTYRWVAEISRRIDDNLYNETGRFDILRRASQGERIIRDNLPPANSFLTTLDINSLIMFLDILLDDASRFLEYLFIEPHFLKFSSFKDLKNSMNNCEGERIDDLNKIIQRTDWYLELNRLRNESVVHVGARDSMVGMQGENVGIYLRTRTKRDKISEETFMSNLEIDELCDNVHSFLRELNDYLCNNFDYLPLESRKK